ncbi:MAG: putative glycosyltransferase [Bacteroidota bacterium]|nr:putative glycosyltransferase [Bacteroidota bacterium]
MARISICLITYNQEKFIAQAIESVLMQEGDLDYEIVISDDYSSDATPDIIKSYADKYPNIIRAYFAGKNLGMLRNWEKALKLCKAPLIALLEGDDFWNDPLKLQKQLQVLTDNPDYVVSFTNAHIKYESGEPGYPTYVTIPAGVYEAKDLLAYNFIPTCSVLMRNHISDTFFKPAYFNSPFADWMVHMTNSQYGKFHFLNEFTCTYRVHGTGVWGGTNSEKQLLNKLKGIDCVAEIVSSANLNPGIKASRKTALQNICAYYKKANMPCKYLLYRIKLLMN